MSELYFDRDIYHLIFYNKPVFENLGFTHMHIHNIVFDIHIFSMNRCKWMKKSQLQQKIGPAKAKGKCNNWLLQANVTTYFYTKLLLDLCILEFKVPIIPGLHMVEFEPEQLKMCRFINVKKCFIFKKKNKNLFWTWDESLAII